MRLLIRNGRAVGIGNRLLVSNDQHCCCNTQPELAYLFCECCDNDPCFWIAQRAFPNGIVRELLKDLGSVDSDGKPTCYHMTDVDRLDAVLSQDQTVRLTLGNLRSADLITSCVRTTECRTCPNDCCIYGYVPRCGQAGSDCCNLGSGYEMIYNYSYYYSDIGSLACETSSVTDAAGGYTQCCQAYSGLIKEIRESRTYKVTHYKTGGICGLRSSTGDNRYQYQEKNLRHDGLIYEPIPGTNLQCVVGLRNPRIEETNNESRDSLRRIARGAYPWGTVENCDFTRSIGQAVGCAYQTDYTRVQAAMSCLSGYRNQFRVVRQHAGCCDRGPYCDRTITTVIQESYTVNILDRRGCESIDCGNISPLLGPPSSGSGGLFNINRTRNDLSIRPDPIVQEASKRGCMSCRQQRGI